MNKPKTRNENIVTQEMNSELLIYDLKTNKAFCLNETSAQIWSLCDGNNSIEQISRILTQKLNQPISEDLVWLALDNFKKDNLLEDSKDFEINFNGLTRRQVIRKIGFASMIALPIIASVVAPSAAMAQSSGVLLGGVCPPACAAGLQCRSLTVGSGSLCCVPGSPFSQTFPPGTPACLTNCATDTSAICCSGSGTTAPASAFCTMFGLQTCTCNPFP